MIQESKIEQKLVKGIKSLGGRAYKWVSPGNTGVPDRQVIFPDGRIEFVELKTDKGRLTPLQRAQIVRLRRLHCIVYVLCGMNDVNEYLDRHAFRLARQQGGMDDEI